MKYIVMIQARSGSTRFPNKVMQTLAGKPMLLQMIDRVKRAKKIDEVIVLTTFQKSDLAIVELCSSHGVRVFAGSENDVLDRYYQAARLLRPEYVIRLTADCPCFDPSLLDMAIQEMDADSDYLGMMSESFPDGLDLEIIKYDALAKAWHEASLKSEREHVTQYIVKHPDFFVCQDFSSGDELLGNERWTVDEPEDFELVSTIFEHFSDEGLLDSFGLKEIREYLDDNPRLRNINSKFARNEGLAKSLREDGIMEEESL